MNIPTLTRTITHTITLMSTHTVIPRTLMSTHTHMPTSTSTNTSTNMTIQAMRWRTRMTMQGITDPTITRTPVTSAKSTHTLTERLRAHVEKAATGVTAFSALALRG